MDSGSFFTPQAPSSPTQIPRDGLGELLVQIDGSPHDWFEGRVQKSCLLVFIDDVTGRLMHHRFGEAESALDYRMATRKYLKQHGKPLKHAIFMGKIVVQPQSVLLSLAVCFLNWD